MAILERIILRVKQTIVDGYYSHMAEQKLPSRTFKGGLIAEIKPESPSEGVLYTGSIEELARIYEKNGAKAISVLVEPYFFGGALENITAAKKATQLPILMKDFIVSKEQLDAGKKAGADIVLLISGVSDLSLITYANSLGLDVLLETHTEEDFVRALQTKANFIGINNRDLNTMKTDVHHAVRMLVKHPTKQKIIAESGITTREEVNILKAAGVYGILVGTVFLKSKSIEQKVDELQF